MQFKTLAFLLVSATAVAAREVEKRQDYSDLLQAAGTDLPSGITIPTTLPSGFSIPSVPGSVVSVLETAVPSSVIDSLLADSSYRSSYVSAIAAGSTPGWYQSLPADVKSYFSTAYLDETTGTGSGASATGTSTGAVATGSSSSGSSSGSSTSGSNSGSSASGSSSSSSKSGSSSSSSPGSSTSGASKAQSTNAAPAPTGAIAGSIAGAAGILALALAL